LALPAFSDTVYRFERLWPTLQQPWHFYSPHDAAVTNSGLVYVADAYDDRIVKLTTDGRFLSRWGSTGWAPGEFYCPTGVAVDSDGNVYVAENGSNRIQKFTATGEYISQWGQVGAGEGEFAGLWSVEVSASNEVYTTEIVNHRVQKFTTDGAFLLQWGGPGSSPGSFNEPRGIAIDSSETVLVADTLNNRIQAFTKSGEFIGAWGVSGYGPGEFVSPFGVAFDSLGRVYVVDFTHRVQRFTSTGVFDIEWGGMGFGWGQLWYPFSAVTDQTGSIYVVDNANDRIQKFTLDGVPLQSWESQGTAPGYFKAPWGIAVSGSDDVYVGEIYNSRIQRFDSEGMFLGEWGGFGTGPGQFLYPHGLSVDVAGNVYVVDRDNDRIQKFTADGVFITAWGHEGSGPGELLIPHAVATDATGNVYVADTENSRIQKFTGEGGFLTLWGGLGENAGEFRKPQGIACGPGVVYVSDSENARVQAFTQDGAFLYQWGGWGSDPGQFYFPRGIAVDSGGAVYVNDAGNYRVQEFTPEGSLVAVWGTYGEEPGQFGRPYSPTAIAVNSQGCVYVVDGGNNRVQKFRPVMLTSNPKAVVVAGGGPFAGNNLWDATQASASFAYRALTNQGFTKETIYYLSSDTNLDLDNNGVADDVDADATNPNLESALTTWAPAWLNGLPTGDVLLYLVDHGGTGTFRMSGAETLSATDLDGWLDTLQTQISGKLIVVYDACESGSFLNALRPPGGYTTMRIVLTSTSIGESAHFVTSGTVSFSNYFWTQVFNGVTVGEAFTIAKDALSQTYDYQTPLLDDNGNGVGNEAGDGNVAAATYIGNGTPQNWAAPVIGVVSPDQTINGTADASLWADPVTDPDGVAHVWAVLRPPDYNQESSSNPVTGLPGIDLQPVGGDRYEATYANFTTAGTYTILIYARDRQGNTSVPMLTHVTVEEPLSRKAVIVAGSTTVSPPLWPAIEYSARAAYQALRFQGYSDDDIHYLSRTTTPGVDGLSALSNLQFALTFWATQSTMDLVVYLVGEGTSSGFMLNDRDCLTSAQLDVWLDQAQASIPGKVTVIYDANYSGGFLPSLLPPSGKQRITVASARPRQTASLASGGSVSFSGYFWSDVMNGASIRDAFTHADNAMRLATGKRQAAMLDDNGDGEYNSKTDGLVARDYHIGAGILLAGDAPLMWSIVGEQEIFGATTATIWVDGVTTTGMIDQVAGVVYPPGADEGYAGELGVFALTQTGANRYEGTYDGFTEFGTYHVSVTAIDTEGNCSVPAETTVVKLDGPDRYEEDNTFGQANWIGVDAFPTMVPDQTHNFHDEPDEDWVVFFGAVGDVITVQTLNLGPNCDTYIELYSSDGMTLIDYNDDGGLGGDYSSYLVWAVDEDGFYLVRVVQSPDAIVPTFGSESQYDLRVWQEIGPEDIASLEVTVLDATGKAIPNPEITLNRLMPLPAFTRTQVGDDGGSYIFGGLRPGSYTVSAAATGYDASSPTSVTLAGGDDAKREITLESAAETFLWGDLNGDGRAGTVDASLIHQWLVHRIDAFPIDAGCTRPCFPPGADVNDDGQPGGLDATGILRKLVGKVWQFAADHNGNGKGPDAGKSAGAVFLPKTAPHWTVPTDLRVLPGAEAKVAITIDDAAGAESYFFAMTYDPAVLEYVRYERGTLLSNAGEPYVNPDIEPFIYCSGSAVDGLTGSGTLLVITFRALADAAGHTSPIHFDEANLNDGHIPIEVTDGLVTVIGFGALRVTIEPTEALADGAQWRVDGGAWQDSGATISALEAGTHMVSFHEATGWVAPADQTASVVTGQTVEATGAYKRPTGALTVAIEPEEALLAGGEWRVDDGAWQGSGVTVDGLIVGEHTVSYKSISGWVTPGSVSVTISLGETSVLTGRYAKETGALRVAIEPSEALAAGAQWRVDGGAWHNSDEVEPGLSIGSHLVEFKPLSSWNTPSSQSPVIEPNTTADITATYTQTGALRVTVEPEAARNAHGQWRLDGGDWLESGIELTGLSLGDHVVSFRDLDGWTTPAEIHVTIQPAQLAEAGGLYVFLTGGICISIEPEGARSGGAQWQVDAGSWQVSGATVDGLAPGAHLVTFLGIAGWNKPVDAPMTVIASQVSSAVFNYDCLPPYPPEGVAASDGVFADKIEVTWDPVDGEHIEYQVLRSSTDNPSDASAISDWITTKPYEDFTADGPGAPPESTGGCPGTLPENKYYYYWVKARRGGTCESNLSSSDQGYRGASKAAPLTAGILQSLGKRGNAGGDILFLAAALAALAVSPMRPRSHHPDTPSQVSEDEWFRSDGPRRLYGRGRGRAG
jgi:hypothetical protein